VPLAFHALARAEVNELNLLILQQDILPREKVRMAVEEALRFDVTMEYPLAVDELQALDQLVEILLHPFLLQRLLALLDVLVHVALHQLEDKC